MFTATGETSSGVELIERQQVSAYTSQWIIFKTNMKDTLKQWVKHPHKNKGEYTNPNSSYNKNEI